MKIFFDTEFHEDGKTIDLISIGMVAEDGRQYYTVSSEFDYGYAMQNEWLLENVLKHLPERTAWKTRAQIRADVLKFVGNSPEFWAYYADYDWVVLCQLYGTMMQLPSGWPMYCKDLKQLCADKGNPELPKQAGAEHNALYDALHNMIIYTFLTK